MTLFFVLKIIFFNYIFKLAVQNGILIRFFPIDFMLNNDGRAELIIILYCFTNIYSVGQAVKQKLERLIEQVNHLENNLYK